MSKLEQYAQWLVANADKKGTPDFETVANAYRVLRSQGEQPQEQAGFVESFKEAATSLKAAPAAAKFAAAQTPQEERAAREELLQAAGDDEFARTAFADIKDFGSALDWAKQTVGASAGFLAAPLVATAATGPVGGAATLATQYTTENLIRQAEEQARAEQEGRIAEETSVGKAVAAAGAATALDVVGFRYFKPIFSKFPIVGKIFGEEGEAGAKEATERLIAAAENGTLKTTKRGVVEGVAKGVAFEIPQEIAQTALERWQAGLSLTDEEAKAEYIEAGAGAVLLGTGLGGAGGFTQSRADRRRAEEAIAEKEQIQKQEAEEKRKAEAEAAGVTEEEKPVTRAKGAATEEELTKAQEILTTLGVDKETKPLDFEVALIEGGIPQNRARRVLAGLRKNKLLEKDDATGTLTFVPPVEVPAFVAPEGAGEFTDIEGAAAPVADETQIEGGEGEPAGTVTSEAVTEPSGAGVGLPVPRERAGRPPTAETTVRGVEPVGADLGRVDEGEAVPQPTLAVEEWRDRVKQSKVKGALSPQSILDRINNLKAELGKYEPVDVLTRNSRIEEVVGLLRQFKQLDDATIEDKLGISRKATIDLLEDLRDEGLVTADNTLVEDAFTVKDQQNRTAYERFLQREETPLQELARSVDDIVDKYSETDVQNSTKTRKIVDERLNVLEDFLAKQKEREAARARREAGVPEAELQKTEAQAFVRAQEKIAAGEEVMSFSGGELRDAVGTKNANAVLEAIESRAAQNQQAALSPESAEVQAEQAASRVRAPAVDTTGLTPEQAARKQREAAIRAAQERRQTKTNVRADLGRVVSNISDPTSTAAIKNEFLSALARRLRALDMSNVGIQVEGEADANAEIFNRLRAENKLAEYDPQTNTIYLREGSVSPKILLHEMVHAATIRILKLYSDPATRGQLNENQIEAAEHIDELFKAAQKRLSGRFPDAFENVFEFVAYGMTDPVFQQELVRIRRPSLAKYTKAPQNLWEQFTDAIMRLFNLATPENLKKKAEYKAKVDKLKDAQRIFEEARRDPEGNLLLELSEAFEQVLSTPEAGVDVPPLAARKRKGRKVKKTRVQDERSVDELLKASPKERQKYSKPTLLGTIKDFFSGAQGYENAVRLFQNDRRAILKLQEQLRAAGLLSYDGPNANNLYDLIALSSGKAFQRMTEFIKPYTDDVHRSIAAYAKAKGLDVDDAVRRLSMYLTAQHEPERRRVKFVMNVPLNDQTKIGSKTLGRTDTAAGHRAYIVKELDNNFAAESKKLKRDLTAAERKRLAESYRQVLDQLVASYADSNGSTPTNAKPGTMPTDINAPEYRVIGSFSEAQLQGVRNSLQADLADPKLGPLLKQMMASLEQVQDNTITLNRESNYWSPPVDNFKNFYGFKNYVPFKGRPDSLVSEGDERFELGGKRTGADYTEIASPFEGRGSESDNVILTALADGAKSAMRNGRVGVTQAIKNLIKDKHINGRLVKTIKFEDRFKEGNRPDQIRGPNKVFHYLPDGTIEVYQINDKSISNAIRRTYEAENPLIELANKITSGIGQLHTRYNPAFYPYNFVRDALTNAFTMGAEMGPESATKYIGAVAAQIGKMGMVKTGRVAKMYAEGRLAELREMAKKDIDVRNVLEYLEEGGRVSYVQGLALQGQKDALLGEIDKKGFARSKEALDKWVDIWADSFEFTSRAAAYSVAKSNALARGLPENQARQEAAAYAKNIANFEQVGEWGKQAGALFMFFRPAATGAVRAFDALAPLFQDIDAAERRLPAGVRENPTAVANFRRNFLAQRQNAKSMMYGLMGAGATLYLMAYMAADDDELGRNRIATDDMSLWTRNLRLPLGFMGSEGFLQIPWGFGLGAFGAAGAQVMGAAVGKTDMKDMAVNMFTIGLDSFMPLPFSRINPLEDTTAWFVDSIMPSAVRPFVQFTMNVDGLGRDIYLNRTTKYGEAFTGGRGVPDLYKDISRGLFNLTNGEVSVQPNTLYFWTNNYVDGVSRIAQSLYGAGLSATGQKEFDPKEDLLVFRSYLGRKTNFDAREFASVEKKINEKREKLNALENLAELSGDPTQLFRYVERNPNDPMIVDIYNKEINREIKQIRSARNAVMTDPNLDRIQRKQILDELDLHQNMLKRGLIEAFRQYNVEP
jgi:hypothetical protein